MAVVLAVHERVCNVLVLNDEKSSENDFEVIAKGVKFTDPCMISYAFNDNFIEFVKCMKDHEFETLTDIVRGELGFNECNDVFEEAAHEKISELKMKLDELNAENANLKEMLKKSSYELAEHMSLQSKQELECRFENAYKRLSIQNELLKEQNEKLIDRLAKFV
jgi:RecA-family ATPase